MEYCIFLNYMYIIQLLPFSEGDMTICSPEAGYIARRQYNLSRVNKKGTSRQRSGKGAIRKRFPLQKPRWEKTKLTIRYLYHETYRKPNEQLSYLNLTKTMKTHIRRQQHKKNLNTKT